MITSESEDGQVAEGLGYLMESIGNYFKENSILIAIILILVITLIIYTINRSVDNLSWLLGDL